METTILLFGPQITSTRNVKFKSMLEYEEEVPRVVRLSIKLTNHPLYIENLSKFSQTLIKNQGIRRL